MRLAALLSALTLLAARTYSQPDPLPRHAVIGIVAAAQDSTHPQPVAQTILPGSAAHDAGVHPGDLLLSLDQQPIPSAADFTAAIARHLGGDRITLNVRRAGQTLTLPITLTPRPYETSPNADILYSSVLVDGARRRILISHPKAPGRFPAVILMGGLGCYSVDSLPPTHPYAQVLAALQAHKFVTLRVEKTGEGDSEGPACTAPEASAQREADGYIAGLAALTAQPFVDPAHVFVFAHSLGPLIGALALPQLLSSRPGIAGFIAAETIGRSWFEYTLENSRRQRALLGAPPDEIDAHIRAEELCAHDFFVLQHPAADVARSSPACAELIASYAGVPGPYMQQIARIDLGLQWKSADIPVLILYGTADPATSADESRLLAATINALHPGRATYVELPNMGHDFALYDSQLDFLTRRDHPDKPHPFNPSLTTAILTWLDHQLQP